MLLKNLKPITCFIALSFAMPCFSETQQETELKIEAQPLYDMLQTYNSYRPALEGYAKTQGFREPYEYLATVVHEIIHVDSAAHRGYWINGSQYVRPYVSDAQAWPALTNKDIQSKLERGPIANEYARNLPNNTLANCLDEINAYTHVIGFVALHEPQTLSKQMVALKGHIEMVKVYLKELDKQNIQLAPESLSAVTLIVGYAEKALDLLK